jgi:hypothetical protein
MVGIIVSIDCNRLTNGFRPAFWLLGPNWPNSGEVDILEGINSQSTNSFALHTNAGCRITQTGKFTGSISSSNCDVNAPDQATNVGCAIKTSDTQSYGTGFNNAGGGVYATQWTSEAISIWFFTRGQIPADINSGSPDPSTWGQPQAQFAGGCDIDTHIVNQQIVFTNTFCGDWGGQVWAQDATCSPLASTCQAFVQNNPASFKNAYWEINSLRVYQSPNGGSDGVAGQSGSPGGSVGSSAMPSGPQPTSGATATGAAPTDAAAGGPTDGASANQSDVGYVTTLSTAYTALPAPANSNGVSGVQQSTDGQIQASPSPPSPPPVTATVIAPSNYPQPPIRPPGAMVSQIGDGQIQAPGPGQRVGGFFANGFGGGQRQGGQPAAGPAAGPGAGAGHSWTSQDWRGAQGRPHGSTRRHKIRRWRLNPW